MAEAGLQPPDGADKSLGEIVTEVSEKASLLVREEIELAKAEVAEKFNQLIRGSVVAAAAGVFAIFALVLAMHGVAWLLNDLFFDDNLWAGFLIEAGLFLLVGIAAGLYAFRSFKRGAPPTPAMAIDEARKTRETLEAGRS
jgi:uncharacterized membrane protein YqjE